MSEVEEKNYILHEDGVLEWNGVIFPVNPTNGHGWLPETVETYIEEQELIALEEAEKRDQLAAEEEAGMYIGHIVFADPEVATGTGHVLEALNPLAPFAETTVTLNSVLKLVANIQLDPEDPATRLTGEHIPDDIFRVPLRNSVTKEVRLFAGLLEDGTITVEAPLDTAGYWEVTQELVNSRLPQGHWFKMDKRVFSVVYSSDTVNAKMNP